MNLRNQINIEPDDITSNSSTRRNIEWSYENEEMLAEWGDIAQCYKWLNTETYKYYKNMNSYLTIPCIVCSTISASASFGIPNVPFEYQYILPYFIGSITICIGVITTVQQFYRLSELKEAHRILAVGWDKMARNIRIELSKTPMERTDARHFIKFTRIEFERLMENSELIPDCIIYKFNNKVERDEAKPINSKFNKTALKKPDICDRIVSINKTRRKWFQSDLENGYSYDTRDSCLYHSGSPRKKLSCKKSRSNSYVDPNERIKKSEYIVDLRSLRYTKPPIEPCFKIDSVFVKDGGGKYNSNSDLELYNNNKNVYMNADTILQKLDSDECIQDANVRDSSNVVVENTGERPEGARIDIDVVDGVNSLDKCPYDSLPI